MSKYSLGNKDFNTWLEVTTHTKLILSKGVRKLVDDDLRFAKDLLKYHPNAESKMQNGVCSIEVGVPSYGSHFCLILTNNDGVKEDFSHYKCKPQSIKNPTLAKSRSIEQSRISAYRTAIDTQTTEYRNNVSTPKCQHCKTRFDLQIDHNSKTFIQLVNEFEVEYKPEKYPTLLRTNDSVHTVKFNLSSRVATKFVAAWQTYHRQHADLQILCGACNLKKGGRIRYKPYLSV